MANLILFVLFSSVAYLFIMLSAWVGNRIWIKIQKDNKKYMSENAQEEKENE